MNLPSHSSWTAAASPARIVFGLQPFLLVWVCVSLLLHAGAVSAQPPTVLPKDTTVRIGQLENGLTYYIRSNQQPRQRAELRLAVNVGSVLERNEERGVAHFVEHMAFNGTRNFAKQEIVDYLESVGMRFGPDVNAYTSFDETVYLLTLPTDSAEVLETGIRILRDWADGVSFDSVEVEKERGVIMEEWRLGRGAGSRLSERHLPVLFHGSRYAERLPIGDTAVLRNVRAEELERFYRTWYRPDLMAVVAVGDFDVDTMEAWVREHFGSMQGPQRTRRRTEYTVPLHRRTLYSIAADTEATGATVSVYRKRRPQESGTVQAYRRYLTETLYHFILYDRLAELTLQPDVPLLSVTSSQGMLVRRQVADVLTATVRPERVLEGLESLLTEARRVAQHGFTESELVRQKRDLMRRWEQIYAERGNTPSAQFTAEYVSHFLYGEGLLSVDTHYEMHRRLLPEITLAEVNAYAREAAGARRGRVVLVTVPEGDEVELPSERAIARVIRDVARRGLVPYDDLVSDLPLVGRPPTPGEIVAETKLETLGVYDWQLSNGARVLLKPTDFRADEILFTAYAKGGTSLAPDSLFIPALTAAGVAQMGGLGELSLTDLVKRLTGKVAGAGAYIDELSQGFSGAASPADLETLFQVVYLRFTEPRVDTTAFLGYQSRAAAELRHRSASPEAMFMDTLQSILTQAHPRARPPSSAMFAEMDLHHSMAFYRERFSDASGFTFIFVGSFDVDTIRPLVERYIASLPSAGRVDHWRDVGIRAPDGVTRRVVRRGSEPKAQTRIVFLGDFDFSRENVYALRSMSEVLQLRLREVLREELGGTYGVLVNGSAARDPHSRYRVSIGFGLAPERIDELTAAVFAQIDSLQRVGPTQQEIDKVREMQLRSREVQMRENTFWTTQLLGYVRHGWDVSELARPELARTLSVEMVRTAARQLLDPGRYVQVSLMPEEQPTPQ
jgi:zinc protease